MSDRALALIGLLGLAGIAGGCLTAMEISQTPIDRGFSALLLTFLGTIAAAFIGLLNNRSISQAASTAAEVKKEVALHHAAVESQLAVNTELTADTRKTLKRIEGT